MVQAENLQHGFAVQSKIFAQTISKDFPRNSKKKSKILSKIFSKKIIFIFLKKSQNRKFRDFRKYFSQSQNFKSCQKSLRILEYLSLEKTSILAKKVFDCRPKNFRPYVEKCQNPLLIPYRNCGRSAHAHAVHHFSRGESADVQRPRRV